MKKNHLFNGAAVNTPPPAREQFWLDPSLAQGWEAARRAAERIAQFSIEARNRQGGECK